MPLMVKWSGVATRCAQFQTLKIPRLTVSNTTSRLVEVTTMTIDWLRALNPSRAVGNIRTEMTGDWYRDPWGWPEYGFLLDNHLDHLVKRAGSRGIRRAARIDVPKENFGIRPAIVMEFLDRLLYQGLVDLASVKLIGDLPSWVHGWRLPRGKMKTGQYSPNDREWERHRDFLKVGALIFEFGLKSDIVSCFASVPIDRLCEDVVRRSGEGEATRRLTDMLTAFDGIPMRGGLPQRSTASAVLANMYLDRFRHAIDDYNERNRGPFIDQIFKGVTAVRWMDDLWAFGYDDGLLRSLQVDLQDVARGAGLELNLGKTELLSDEDLWASAQNLQHSAIDAAIDMDPPDLEPLEHLLDQIIETPELADRTTIRFAMTRMRRQRLKSRLEQLVHVAPRMPQGADHLARAFRDFGLWRTHDGWYLDYVDSPWSRISWSVAQIGTMFPTRKQPSAKVRERFAHVLESRADFSMLGLTAQRLAAWAPRLARDLLRELVRVADHPQERRVIALACTAAGEEKKFIRAVLGEYEENHITLEMLEERRFRPIEAAPDFGAD